MMKLLRRHRARWAAWFSLMVLWGLAACSDDTATDAAIDIGTPDGSEGDADERTDTLTDAPMDTSETERCPEDYYVVVGTEGDDVLEGTDGPDCIVGLAGDDTLRGFGGDDLLFGGEGADRLEGGEGADELDGGEGCDVLTALGSNNTLSGGGGNDVLSGGQSPALLDAGEGDDWVSFEGNAARVLGGGGVDRCAVPTGGGMADGPTADEIEGCEATMAPLCGAESDCSFGVCTAGTCVVSDYCGRRCALEDETCDGFDDDCDGVSDEGYTSSDSSCGEGACAAEGRSTCEMGSDGMVREQDSCTPGTPATSDATCDGVDDDCDGRVDEDFALRCDGAGVVSCDEGVEARADCDDGSACTGIESCVDGACTRGVPLTTPECACEVGTCPEDPYPLAPPLPSDGHSPEFAETVRFLVEGPAAVQMGVAVDELNDARLSRLYGRVITTDGLPFGSCRVSVLGHPEMGFTFTREDGAYDLLVNGGGHLALLVERDGYMPVQRRVSVRWHDHVQVPDVALTAFDAASTDVLLDGTGLEDTWHTASESMDDDGTRRARLRFSPGTVGTAVLADGSRVPLGMAKVRATELTVGPNGQAALPGEMPRHIAYTYAVELSLDEAEAMGATRVDFDRPVFIYVDNFLGYDVGGAVPSGYYDEGRSVWVPDYDGSIISILEVDAMGLAVLDVTGEGRAATEEELSALSVTANERRELALRYDVGDSIWRVGLNHFTTWDHNWSRLMPGADSPAVPEPDADDEDPDSECGSLIQCQNRIYSEFFPVAGTSRRLAYHAHRTPADVRSRMVRMPVRRRRYQPLNPFLEQWVEVEVAGVVHRIPQSEFVPIDGTDDWDMVEWEWDGLDFAGRPTGTPQPATISNCVVYSTFVPSFIRTGGGGGGGGGSPSAVASFGARGGDIDPSARLVATRDTLTICRSREEEVFLSRTDNRDLGLGGLELDSQPRLDASAGVLRRGDGTFRRVSELGLTTLTSGRIFRPGDDVTPVYLDDGELLSGGRPGNGQGISVLPNGHVVFGDRRKVFEVLDDGTVRRIVGSPAHDPTIGLEDLVDGSPAANTQIGLVQDVEVGPSGSLWVLATYGGTSAILERRVDGTLWRVAGRERQGSDPNPSVGNTDEEIGEGGDARDAYFRFASDLAIGSDGTVHFIDDARWRIRSVTTDGRIHTLAGTADHAAPTPRLAAEDARADEMRLLYGATSIAVDPEDNVVFAMASQLFRITEDGTVDKLTGTAPTGDWSTASPVRADRYHATAYDNVDALTVFPDGRILFWDDDAWWLLSGEGARGLIRRLSSNAAPAEVGAPPYRNLPLQTARFAVIGSEQQDTAIGPDGSVYFLSSPRHPGGANHWGIHRAKSGGGFVRFDYVDSDGETKEGARVASEDGRMLFDFDMRGRLMAWRGADDGQVRERFEYVGGLLSRIIDERAIGSGREFTTLTRDAAGLLITAPYGEQTRVAFDGTDGASWAETIRYPGNGMGGAPRDDVDDALVTLEIDDSSEARMNDRDGLLLSYTDRRGHLHRMEYDDFGRLLQDENVATGYRWTLEEAPVVVAPAVYEEGVTRVVTREVTLTGATGLSNVHRTIDSEDGVRVRELVSPDGTVTRTEELELRGSGDLRQLLSTPDGMESEVLFSVDPVLGNVRPQAVTYRRPSGAETQTRFEVEATRAPGEDGGVGESERVERWITNVENPGFEALLT